MGQPTIVMAKAAVTLFTTAGHVQGSQLSGQGPTYTDPGTGLSWTFLAEVGGADTMQTTAGAAYSAGWRPATTDEYTRVYASNTAFFTTGAPASAPGALFDRSNGQWVLTLVGTQPAAAGRRRRWCSGGQWGSSGSGGATQVQAVNCCMQPEAQPWANLFSMRSSACAWSENKCASS